MLRRGLAAALCVIACAPLALADESGEPIALDYRATSDCPDAAAFEQMVRGRTNRARFVASGQARTFAVTLTRGPHASGRLTVLRSGSIEGVREVHADSCAEGAEALALMVALAVDPSAILGPAAPTNAASGAPSPPAATTASAQAVQEEPPAVTQSPPSPLPAPLATTPPPSESPAPTSAAPPPHTVFVGTDLVVAGGAPSNPLFGVAPLLGWRSSSTGLIAPSIRASFLHAGSSVGEATGGSAAFTWNLGRLEGCVLSWPPGPAHLLACARVEAGVVDASGSGVPLATSRERAWVALGPVVRGEWSLLGPLFLTIDAAPMVRATTDRFYFRPDSTVYQVSWLGFEGGAGIGVHFF
ncbi:MAG TPA: hypothetical protein VF765_22865 [Polyangiaceae bacterium]